MRTSDSKDIERFLIEHRGFAECIIEKFLLTDYGTTFEVAINYIWDAVGKVRSKIDESQVILLRFRSVQELHINNALTQQMLRHPQEIDWGLNEIARLVLVSDTVDAGAEHLSLHLAFIWEGDRRIDVIFSELEVVH